MGIDLDDLYKVEKLCVGQIREALGYSHPDSMSCLALGESCIH